MNLTLFVTDNCNACERVRKHLTNILKEHENISFYVENIKYTPNKSILIVPALYVNDELYSYGDLDEEKFLKIIENRLI
ncbi:MAG: thioredoxin family protein [Ignavibacteriaceae bacterium]